MLDEGIREELPLLRASAADVLILRLSCDAVAGTPTVREAEASIVAGDSGGLWGAYARVALPVLFTAIERIIATFATDRVLDWEKVLALLESGAPVPTRTRMPNYRRGMPRMNCESLEQDLLQAFSTAGVRVEPPLVRRIVALKKLRNECVHVRPASAEDRNYLIQAGFSGAARELGLEDSAKAVEVVSDVLRVFSALWLDEPWSSTRVDAMSDLPIYVDELTERLRSHATHPATRQIP
jgi:hypothetical protein